MDYKRKIADGLTVEGFSSDDVYAMFTLPPTADAGELALPCFKFSKSLKKAPQAIAEELAARLPAFDFVEKTQCVAGYLNFYFRREGLVCETLRSILDKGEDFAAHPAKGKTVCLDYSSINIAKPFHIGHLLTTVLGGSLHRIYKYLGYNTVGINHLGDWGTQFGKLIVAYKKWGDDADIEKRTIRALLDLYVRFHAEAERDESLNEQGRAWFKRIEDGDPEALEIFERFKRVTLVEVDKVYDRLGIRFDSYAGESFYNDKMDGVLRTLTSKGLLAESEGAKVVPLDAYEMPPCLILKSDGASLYATRDLAAAIYRKNTYDFYKCLYVVAYQQNLHFRQIFKVLELMGYDWAGDCVHVAFGMVSLEDGGALSTRKGNVVFLSDVLDTSVRKAEDIVAHKSPDLIHRKDIAESVGVGAVIFGALNTARIKDMVFSYEKALNFDGETAPYIQYTHARCCSVLRKAGVWDESDGVDWSVLTDADSFDVVKLLGRFEEVVAEAAAKYEPSLLARYLVDISQSYNRFYIGNRILGENENVKKARLVLTRCVKNTLRNGLNLILIKAPEQM